jgi:hypothetical protein
MMLTWYRLLCKRRPNASAQSYKFHPDASAPTNAENAILMFCPMLQTSP